MNLNLKPRAQTNLFGFRVLVRLVAYSSVLVPLSVWCIQVSSVHHRHKCHMDRDMWLFESSQYANVVREQARAPKRAYSATSGPLSIWIQVYPNEHEHIPSHDPTEWNLMLNDLMPVYERWSNPYLVSFVDIFPSCTAVYVVTESCPNGTLQNATRVGALEDFNARLTFRRIATGIESLHDCHIAHRGLSLEAILLNQDRLPVVSKYTDARVVMQPYKITAYADPLPLDMHYTPPELLAQAIQQDILFEYDPFALDIWRLGVMLFCATTGAYPFGMGQNVEEIYRRQQARDYRFSANVSAPLAELIRTMLDPTPEARPTIRAVLSHAWFNSD